MTGDITTPTMKRFKANLMILVALLLLVLLLSFLLVVLPMSLRKSKHTWLSEFLATVNVREKQMTGRLSKMVFDDTYLILSPENVADDKFGSDFLQSSLTSDNLELLQQRQIQQTLNHSQQEDHDYRRKLANRLYYYVTRKDPQLLPRNNTYITLGNPLKGFAVNALIHRPTSWNPNLPASIGSYKWALSSFMLADPDIVGETAAFNWTLLDNAIEEARLHKFHIVIRFFAHWVGQPLYLPAYLFGPGYNITTISTNNNLELYYNDPVLRHAFKQFLTAFAKRYDGHPSIYVFQAGLLGYWGEWHTNGCLFNGESCLPASVVNEFVLFLSSTIKRTHIQVRYPDIVNAFENGMGFHDDSYTFQTLGGIYNGNSPSYWHFWPTAERSGTSTFWQTDVMGGELRPESNDIVFAADYDGNTENKHFFDDCTRITHASFMDWGRGYMLSGQLVNGTELENARRSASLLGYNYEIDTVAIASVEGSKGKIVTIDVTVQQSGVSPFYYPLNLTLACNITTRKGRFRAGVPKLVLFSMPLDHTRLLERPAKSIVSFQEIPARPECLRSVLFQLDSPVLYPDRPILWAQGNGRIMLNIPLPDSKTQSPTSLEYATNTPTLSPILSQFPSLIPTSSPTTSIGFGVFLANSLNSTIFYHNGKIPTNFPLSFSRNIFGYNLTMVVVSTSNINKVDFSFPSSPGVRKLRIDESRPFAMSASFGGRLSESAYVSSLGNKTIRIREYSNNTMVAVYTVSFMIEDDILII